MTPLLVVLGVALLAAGLVGGPVRSRTSGSSRGVGPLPPGRGGVTSLVRGSADARLRTTGAAAVVAAVAAVALGSASSAPVVAVAAGAGSWILSRRAARRHVERTDAGLARELPDALELLAAAADGGAPLVRSLAAVARHVPEPLSSALARAATTTARPDGPSLAHALAAEGPALRAMAALVGAAEDLGTPIAASLRTLARDERERTRRRARERAAAAAPKLMLVVGTLLAPAALLLILTAEILALLADLGAAGP